MDEFKPTGVFREYKDRLFRLLFGREEYKENILSLYNALNGTNYTNPDDLEITTLKDVIYVGMKNDVSMIIHDTMTLWEQQSTYNPNMPLRGLIYFSRLYDAFIDRSGKNIYGTSLIKIPTPQYVVLYNGTSDRPATEKLKLSDAFAVANPESTGEFEWTATMININKGKNPGILEKCPALAGYMELLSRVQHNREDLGMPAEDAVDTAVRSCIEDGILEEFLREHRAEVFDVCLTEFNAKRFEEMTREEGRAEGRAEGRIQTMRETAIKMLKKGFGIDTSAECSGLSLEEVQALAATL